VLWTQRETIDDDPDRSERELVYPSAPASFRSSPKPCSKPHTPWLSLLRGISPPKPRRAPMDRRGQKQPAPPEDLIALGRGPKRARDAPAPGPAAPAAPPAGQQVAGGPRGAQQQQQQPQPQQQPPPAQAVQRLAPGAPAIARPAPAAPAGRARGTEGTDAALLGSVMRAIEAGKKIDTVLCFQSFSN
jgi:hypothetical protein